MCSILVNVLWTLEENVYSAVVGQCSINVDQISVGGVVGLVLTLADLLSPCSTSC